MNEQIKKIGKIILFVFAALIVLAIVAQIFFKSTPVPMFTNYGGVATMESAGLGESFGGVVSQKAIAPGVAMDIASDESRTASDSSVSADKKIKKNGSLNLYVKNVEESINGVKTVANNLKGLVLNSNISKTSSGSKYGYITIKVPVSSFEQAMSDLKKLAVEVENENTEATDVTEEYTDLESQLKNLKAEEAQYLQIMNRAQTVEEILNVSSRLSDVRGRIEYTQGRINYLGRQVDMSTINVTLSTDADFEVWGIRWRPLIVAKNAVKNLLTGLANYADAMIKLIIALPVVIIWFATVALIIWAGWKILRWIYSKFIKDKKVV